MCKMYCIYSQTLCNAIYYLFILVLTICLTVKYMNYFNVMLFIIDSSQAPLLESQANVSGGTPNVSTHHVADICVITHISVVCRG